MSLPGLGASGGVLGAVVFGVLAPHAMVSDGFYAMVGVVVSAVSGATATVLVALITSRANRRPDRGEGTSDDPHDDEPGDDLSRRRHRP